LFGWEAANGQAGDAGALARQQESEKPKMVSIRRMTPLDIEVVSELDALAFAAPGQQTGHNGPVHPRTHDNVLACLNLNPSGCFVAETDKLIGYIFTRVWGTKGWIGTFGVHPHRQGQGIGKSLLSAAVEHLQRASCTTIGLETMSSSPSNVGFYSRSGFLLTFPTVLLVKETGRGAMASPCTLLSQLENEEALSAITQVSEVACPGLDYAPEVSNAREYKWGETLILGWPEPWAFAIVRTTPKREGLVWSMADVSVLVLCSKAEERLAEALRATESFAHSRRIQQLILAVNTTDGEALQQSLDYGFRVHSVWLRMILDGKDTPPVGRVLSRWLM
jgi:ribosomal protein S18 acetylase RimI-like enzyme